MSTRMMQEKKKEVCTDVYRLSSCSLNLLAILVPQAEAMDDEGSPSGEQNSADAPTTSSDVPTTSGDVPTTSSNAESGTSASSSDQGPSTSATPPDTVGPSAGEGSNGGKEEEEEDESDLKLAWEMLELARVICQK